MGKLWHGVAGTAELCNTPCVQWAVMTQASPVAAGHGNHGLAGVRFAVVDVETSGLLPGKHRLLQVAAVVIDSHGTVIESWSTYVRPRWWRLARTGPRHIHGIGRRDLRDAPRVADVIGRLAGMLDGAVAAGHNVEFDLAFLNRAASRAGVPLRTEGSVCTLHLSRRLDPEREQSHRLGDVAARYGVPYERAHDALADAEVAAAVLPHLIAAHHVTNLEELLAAGSASAREPVDLDRPHG